MSVKMTLKGYQETLDALRRFNMRSPDIFAKAIQFLAEAADTASYIDTPVRTGFLRDSRIVEQRDALSWALTWTAYYACWVNNGHLSRSGTWVPGRFFAEQTLQDVSGLIASAEFLGVISAEIQTETGIGTT
jgi:hypothetical protein